MSSIFSIPLASSSAEISRLQRPDGLAQLFVLYRSSLRRIVSLQLSSHVLGRVDPSDILQETYLTASRRLDEFLKSPPMAFRHWLRLLANQLVVSAHRRHLGSQRRSVMRERMADGLDVFSGNAPDPTLQASHVEQRILLQRLMETLNETDREVLHLRHVEGRSNTETAELLGISTAAASKRHSRALEHLREMYTQQEGLSNSQ